MFFSIIVPVLNEAEVMEEQLVHVIHQCVGYEYELLIVDGGSTDQTVTIAERYGMVIHAEQGRARQMNAGAAAARGDVLLFLHADTQLPDSALNAIAKALESPEVVGGAFRLRFDCARWPYQLVAFTTNVRSQVRRIFTGDQGYFVRAKSFQEVGGYPDQPLMEDLEIITRLRKLGKVVLLPEYVTTSARRHAKIGLWRSVLFMWYLRTLYKFGVTPEQLQRMYVDIR